MLKGPTVSEAERLDTLAPNEERYVLAEALTLQVYVTPWAYRLDGPLDVQRLERALLRLIERHPILRTNYIRLRSGDWRRRVDDRGTVQLQRLDLPGANQDEVRRALRGILFAPIDFTTRTLQRQVLVCTAKDCHWLAISLHHSIGDGVTANLFVRELLASYTTGAALPRTPDMRGCYPDRWRDDPAYKASLHYWTTSLRGLGESAAAPSDLDSDNPGDLATDIELRFDGEAFRATKDAAANLGVSHFTLHYAAALLTLTRLLNRPLVLTNFQSAGRRGLDADDRLGCFSNALPLAQTVDEHESFRHLASRLQSAMREALRFQAAPLGDIMRAAGVQAEIGINWFPELPPLAG